MSSINVRPATRQDIEAIHNLRLELARCVKMDHLPMMSPKELERDGFDADPPYFRCLVAEALVSDNSDEGFANLTVATPSNTRVVGYALYYDNYYSMDGKGLMLQDFCVSEDFRGQGIGELLLGALAKIGIGGNYSRITLNCLARSPARKFYQKNHGIDITEAQGTCCS